MIFQRRVFTGTRRTKKGLSPDAFHPSPRQKGGKMIGRAYCSAQALCVAFTMLLAACGGGGGGSSGPSLSVSTTNVTFTAIQNGATPATQNVGVSISGGTV